MEWTDDAIVLSARRHGESSAVVSLLTRAHGRHAGLVRGGAGRRAAGIHEPGNRVHAVWRARLAEHLGTLVCELTGAVAAPLLDDPERLAALGAACAMVDAALPEREPHPAVFEGLGVLLDVLLDGGPWGSVYVKWEVGLLAELGFGLDLSCCAATGATEDLVYVSPKSGRAVSAAAGRPYHDRMLPLPAFLLAEGEAGGRSAVLAGLELTGYFLETHVLSASRRALPAARVRLAERLRRPRDGSG